MDDLISRNEVVYDIDSIKPQSDETWYSFYQKVLKIISSAKTIQPEREKGKWLINSDGYYPYCSNCKNEPTSRVMTDFCDHCGADMRGEQDEQYKGATNT